ncbi:hypothetical protein EVG20_g8004 [Dentipellis fragilis]|uniref:3'-5' exonuclease n=1 Tax=Dentipellis fragilis TaxID=205917 RepID=A0A4Y9YBJ6_9AGAM|nr:hypothetical protein EVG20_g8004 [Dentipellis fragilis]
MQNALASASRARRARSPASTPRLPIVQRRSFNASRVLAALEVDASPKRPSADDVIDLTTPTPPKKRRSLTGSPPLAKIAQPVFTGSVKENTPEAPKSPTKRTRRTSKAADGITLTEDPSLSALEAPTEKPAPKPKPVLPLFAYKDSIPNPKVIYTRVEEEADELVQALNGPVGFDLEWRVIMRRGPMIERRTALRDEEWDILAPPNEAASADTWSEFPQKVKELIESPTVVKMGANIRNDGMKLYRDFGILASNLVELGGVARQADERFEDAYKRSIVSLAKVVAFYLHRALEKGPVRISNWEEELSREQMEYAANDAYCALMVYKRCLALARDSKRTLIPAEYTSDLYREMNPPSPSPPASPAKIVSVTAASSTSVITTTSTTSTTISASTSASISTTTASTSTAGPSRTPTRTRTRDPYDDLRPPPRPQELRAYTFWRRGDGLARICATLRSAENPLKESTVISYVVRALEADPKLPFSMRALRVLVQMEAGSWVRHREIITRWVEQGRGAEEDASGAGDGEAR